MVCRKDMTVAYHFLAVTGGMIIKGKFSCRWLARPSRIGFRLTPPHSIHLKSQKWIVCVLCNWTSSFLVIFPSNWKWNPMFRLVRVLLLCLFCFEEILPSNGSLHFRGFPFRKALVFFSFVRDLQSTEQLSHLLSLASRAPRQNSCLESFFHSPLSPTSEVPQPSGSDAPWSYSFLICLSYYANQSTGQVFGKSRGRAIMPWSDGERSTEIIDSSSLWLHIF